MRVGRYGPYVEETVPQGVDLSTGEMTDDAATSTPRRATINDDIAPDEMTPARARELLEQSADDGKVLGQDPETGRDIVAKAGRYGPYVTEVLRRGDRGAQGQGQGQAAHRVSLFKDMDLATMDLDTALKLLSLPRVVGMSTEEDGTPVEITAQNGRYGPYLKKGTDSRSLTTEQQLFDITLEEALAIYAQPKQRGRAAAAPLKELGNDPVSGQADGGQGRPLRRLRHRRRDQLDPAQGRRPRVDHARARRRAARREAGQGPDDPQAGGQEDDQEDRHQEDDGQEDDGQEGRGQEGARPHADRRRPPTRAAGPAPRRPSSADRRLPSVAAGLVRGGELVWSGAVGTLVGRADGEPADDRHAVPHRLDHQDVRRRSR